MHVTATDLIQDSCWGMGSVKVRAVTVGLHNTKCVPEKEEYIPKCAHAHVSFHRLGFTC